MGFRCAEHIPLFPARWAVVSWSLFLQIFCHKYHEQEVKFQVRTSQMKASLKCQEKARLPMIPVRGQLLGTRKCWWNISCLCFPQWRICVRRRGATGETAWLHLPHLIFSAAAIIPTSNPTASKVSTPQGAEWIVVGQHSEVTSPWLVSGGKSHAAHLRGWSCPHQPAWVCYSSHLRGWLVMS